MLARDLRSTRSTRQVLILAAVVTFLLVGPLGIYLHPASFARVSVYVTDKHAEWFAPGRVIPCDPCVFHSPCTY